MKNIPQVYGEILVEIGKKYPDVIVVDADLPDSCKTEMFAKVFPERVWDIGIAEQSLPTVSAGLALCGKIPVYNSFAVFAIHRGVDMIRQSICYNNSNVKIVGHAAGQSMGYTGPSHHTIEDLAIIRALPGMCIMQPSDCIELEKMMYKMVEHQGPVYLRLPRVTVADLHDHNYEFNIGQPDVICDGNDISMFVTGDLCHKALSLVNSFKKNNISIQLVNIPSIKPVDVESIIALGNKTKGAVTLEDHNIIGGLGSLISEIYSEFLFKPVKRIGINDTFTESADADLLRDKYGLGEHNIYEAVDYILKCNHLNFN